MWQLTHARTAHPNMDTPQQELQIMRRLPNAVAIGQPVDPPDQPPPGKDTQLNSSNSSALYFSPSPGESATYKWNQS